jgi:hypothetical protein
VYLLVSQEKWDKVKVLLTEVIDMWETSKNNMSRKRLEQIQVFFNYVCQTYRFMTPYLIGFHMTVDSWRPNRDSEGWRLRPQHVWRAEESGDWEEHVSEPDGPVEVKAVPRLRQDLEALQVLTQGTQPPFRRVRGSATGCAYYGFGDASGSAFGATIQIGNEVEYECGQWSLEVVEEETSNWKEIANLVRALYRLVKEKGLQGTEIFVFTDNSTAEGAFWKGTSKSRRLFELVLELKQLKMEADLILHTIQVSGRQMIIVQGMDGLSRADHSRGVMSGRPMLEFVPLHLSALDRKPDLKRWINSVMCGLDPVFLSPEGWFDEGHGRGTLFGLHHRRPPMWWLNSWGWPD